MKSTIAIVIALSATFAWAQPLPNGGLRVQARQDSAGKPEVCVGYDISTLFVKAKASEIQVRAQAREAQLMARELEWQAIDAEPFLARMVQKLGFHIRNVSQDHPVVTTLTALAGAVAAADAAGWINTGSWFDSSGSSRGDAHNDSNQTGNGPNVTVQNSDNTTITINESKQD